MTKIYDIVVSGGGSAGMAAAINARLNGLSVVVIDAAGELFDKPCGEGLMPAGIEALKSLGVDLQESFIKLKGISYHFPSKITQYAHFASGREAIGLRRNVLRPALWARARELGVEVIEKGVGTFEVSKDFVLVEGIKAKWWIIAEGLRSKSVSALNMNKERAHISRFGLRQHFSIKPWSEFVEVYWGKNCEVYITPVSKDTVNVAILANEGKQMLQQLEEFPELMHRLINIEAVSKPAGAGPLYKRTFARKKGRVLLAGDSAGFVDAMTGEGNTLALLSGIACTDLIAKDRTILYPLVWWTIVWKYWFLTKISLFFVGSDQLRYRAIHLMEKYPVIFKSGLRFLIAK